MRDIGANLTNKVFYGLLPTIVKNAKVAGLTHIDITVTSIFGITEALNLVKQYPDFLSATAGIHPHNAKTFKPEDLKVLDYYWQMPQVLMAGEMGLDSEHVYSSFEQQKICFERQLDLACKGDKPLFLHFRGDMALREGLDMLNKRERNAPAIVHCFTGDTKQAQDILNHGCYIGITGWVTDIKRGTLLREAVRTIPLDRIMVETDAPYLTPRNLKNTERGQKNYPEYLPFIVEELAALLGKDKEEVAQVTQATADSIIGF